MAESVLNLRNRKEYLFPLESLPVQAQERHYEQQSSSLSAPAKAALEEVRETPKQRPIDLSLIHI